MKIAIFLADQDVEDDSDDNPIFDSEIQFKEDFVNRINIIGSALDELQKSAKTIKGDKRCSNTIAVVQLDLIRCQRILEEERGKQSYLKNEESHEIFVKPAIKLQGLIARLKLMVLKFEQF